MNQKLSTEAMDACLEVLRRGLAEIRTATWRGDLKRAELLSDALHNLPTLLKEGDRYGWTIRQFLQMFLDERDPVQRGMRELLEPFQE